MQAYYEIETEIPLNHQLKLQLPDSIPSDHAKITVIYEVSKTVEDKSAALSVFLEALPNTLNDKGMSRGAINDYIQQERKSWD